MAPTIKEVAERAQVSVSTVSRVLNDYPFVSAAARQRVTDAMRALDYRPDMAARSMRTGTTRAVGFVVSDITNPVFAAVAKGADAVLHPHGYSLVLANSGGDPEHEAELFAALRQRRVDGLIVAVADERSPGVAERLSQVPACVLFDREVVGSAADAVCSDHATGMAEALAHLAALGHVRVGIVAGQQGQLGSRARVVAYRNAAARLGLHSDRRLEVTGRLSRETGYAAVRELLGLPQPPTALIAGNNQLTVGALEALRELGTRIPADLSLVACDDIDLARMHDPPLDVIERDPEQHGRATAELLLRRLEDPAAPPHRVLLPTSFVQRESSDVPAAAVGARAR